MSIYYASLSTAWQKCFCPRIGSVRDACVVRNITTLKRNACHSPPCQCIAAAAAYREKTPHRRRRIAPVDSITSAHVVMQLCHRHRRLPSLAAAADKVRRLLLRHPDHEKYSFHLPSLRYLYTVSGKKMPLYSSPNFVKCRPILKFLSPP